MRDSILHIHTKSSSNEIKSLVVIFIALQLTLRSIVEHRWDHVCLLDDLPDGTSMAQKIIASSVFLVTEILAIENHKLYNTFFLIAFGSQSLLKPTSDQIGSDIN
jgi:hypothetical protein